MRPPHEGLCPTCCCDPDPPCPHQDLRGNEYGETCTQCGMQRRVAGEWYWLELDANRTA